MISHSYVIANDLSPDATAAMRRNVDINHLGPEKTEESSTNATTMHLAKQPMPTQNNGALGKVRVHEGDAWSVTPCMIQRALNQ